MIIVVAVNELKTKLSEMLARVQVGAIVILTNRGRPFARIDPPDLADDIEGHVAKLVSMGLAHPPSERLDEAFFESPAIKAHIPGA